MRDHITTWPVRRSIPVALSRAVTLIALATTVAPQRPVHAEANGAGPAINSAKAVCDPFGPVEVDADPFETTLSDTPIDAAAYVPKRTRWEVKQTDYQGPVVETAQSPATIPPRAAAASIKDPCAAAEFKPLSELGIGIAQPDGQSPTDFATPCWNQINTGSNGVCRCWPTLCYRWDATCLCYQPLYFEEANAERYGYICNDCCCCGWCSPQDCWQSAASAAHFFGTVPCLPYCLVAECPTKCVYTLGHYRPGTCGVPWRRNYPPCDPVAAVSAGGIYTGLIFAIP